MADVIDLPEEISAAEKNKRYCAAYYRLNKGRILDRVKHYSLEKKDEISKMKKIYYQRHKARIRAAQKIKYDESKAAEII